MTAVTREAEPAAEEIRSVPDVESALDGDLQAFDRLVLGRESRRSTQEHPGWFLRSLIAD